MPTRRPLLPPAFVLFAAAAAACGSTREERARAAQEKQVRELARQAAAMATDTSDSAAAARSPVHRATIPNRLAPPGGLSVADGGAPGELRIVSTDGAVVYTLLRDTVRMQLSDSLVRDVRRKIERDSDASADGFAGFFKRTVAGAVGGAMGFVVRTPVRDIQSARYENGELRIESKNGHGNLSVGGKHDGKHDRTTFAPADAERFVAAVNGRRRALGVE